MADSPLPASTQVSALVRIVQAAGGFATVLVRGTEWGGALLLVHREAGRVRAYEKPPSLDGRERWVAVVEGEDSVSAFVAAQRRFDPDLWVLELDIADPARFVPGMPQVN